MNANLPLPFHAVPPMNVRDRDMLQLRQAKLSFPSVHLVVGVFSDELCEQHNTPSQIAHEDRCEVLRHCRWVDEVVPDAPWTLHEKFLRARQIDYVAIDEGTSIDPDCDRDRLKGYDLVKSLRESFARLVLHVYPGRCMTTSR